jgi:hypothetical protein
VWNAQVDTTPIKASAENVFVATTSAIRLEVMDTSAVAQGKDALLNSPYSGFVFTATNIASGQSQVVTLQSQAINNAQTYDQFALALQVAANAALGAGAVSISVGSDFTVLDTQTAKPVMGKQINIFSTGSLAITTPPGSGWLASDSVPANAGLHTNYISGTFPKKPVITPNEVVVSSTVSDLTAEAPIDLPATTANSDRISAPISLIRLQVMDTLAVVEGKDPLLNSPYSGFVFTTTNRLTGLSQVVTLQSQDINDAQTYDQLALALQAAADDALGAGAASVSVGGNFTVVHTPSDTPVTGQEINILSTGSLKLTTPLGSGWVAAPADYSSMYTEYTASRGPKKIVIIRDDISIDPGELTPDSTVVAAPVGLSTAVGNAETIVVTSTLIRLMVIDTRAVAEGKDPLLNSPYGGFVFTATNAATGQSQVVTLQSQDINDARNYDQLAVALQAAADAAMGAGAVSVSVGGNFTALHNQSGTPVTGQQINISPNGVLVLTTPPGSGWLAVPDPYNLHTDYSSGGSRIPKELVPIPREIIADGMATDSTSGDLATDFTADFTADFTTATLIGVVDFGNTIVGSVDNSVMI